MKKVTIIPIIIIIAGLFLFNPSYVQAYYSNDNSYTVTPPIDWVEIPYDVIQERTSVLFDEGYKDVVYETGFQLEGKDNWFVYPYVLIQVMDYKKLGVMQAIDTDSMEDFVSEMTGISIDEFIDAGKLSEEGEDLIEVADIGMHSGSFDASKKEYSFLLNGEAEGFGQIKGKAKGYFGKNAIIQILFYSLKDDWSQYSEVREIFESSFKFDSSAVHVDPTINIISGNERAATSAFGGLIMGGLVGLIIAIFGALKWKKKKNIKSKDLLNDS